MNITEEMVKAGVDALARERTALLPGEAARVSLLVVAAAAPLIAAQALREAYWKQREHASGYRDTHVFQNARERWEADKDNERMYRRYVTHEFFARGIEAAARDLAELLGVEEYDIESPDAP